MPFFALPGRPATRRAVVYAAIVAMGLVTASATLYALVPPGTAPLDYIERTTGGAQPGETLPLLVAIHGRGGSPSEFADAFRELAIPARIVLPRAPDPFDAGGSWYPLDNPLRRPVVIRQRTLQLVALIEHVVRTRPTVGLPVVTGFSQGGVMSYALAANHPEHIAAAFPIAGTRYVGMSLPRKTGYHPAFHAFHGHDDPIMPLAGAEEMVAGMRQAGSFASLTDHRAIGHALTDEIRREVMAGVARALTAAREMARDRPRSRSEPADPRGEDAPDPSRATR